MARIEKALVVGGGIAGMACAIQMRKIGIDVDLIDIDPDWRIYGAGITVTGPTLRALRIVGVLDEVVEHGATWNHAKIHDQSGRLLTTMDLPLLSSGLPASGGVMRPILHSILSRKTRDMGVQVRLGVTVTTLWEVDDHADVHFSDGSQAKYDLVVGADGIFSKLRTRIFPEAPKPIYTGQVIYRLVAERPPGFDCTHFYMGADCKVGFNPVSATHMYMYLLHPGASDPWIDPQDQPQKLYDAMQGFGGMVPEVRATVLTSNAHSVNYRQLEVLLHPAPWYRGRVLLIGDAAHATTPHLASGAGMAIEDGVVLVEELVKSASLLDAFDAFMTRRFDRCRAVIENSVELGRLEINHGSMAMHTQLMNDSLALLRQAI